MRIQLTGTLRDVDIESNRIYFWAEGDDYDDETNYKVTTEVAEYLKTRIGNALAITIEVFDIPGKEPE